MKFRNEGYENYTYLVFSLNKKDDSQILDYIKDKALKDSGNVNIKAPNGIPRESKIIYWKNLGGVLAEAIVKNYLSYLINLHKLDAKILPSPFTTHVEHRDIKLEINGKIKTIEVRSSFNYLAKLEGVLTGKFSLIGPYTTSYKETEQDKDFYITVIHRYKDDLIESKMESSCEVFIIGGASNEKFKEIGKKDAGKLKQEKAEYLIISPINSVDGVPTLFNQILEINDVNPLEQQPLT